MNNLIRQLQELKSCEEVYGLVQAKLKQFQSINRKSDEELFSELAFCILTANFNAERTIRIQQVLGNKFLLLSEKDLSEELKNLGHRYPNTRAKYVVEARKKLQKLKELLKSNANEFELRTWLAKNIKGLGMKESSHFLRNIGFKNVAIIDFHILDILDNNGLIAKPKTLTAKRYLEIEQLLAEIAKQLNVSLAELDLMLWYMETGKILK